MITYIRQFFTTIGHLFTKILGLVALVSSIIAILDFLFKWGVLLKVYNFLVSIIRTFIAQIIFEYTKNPILFTLVIISLIFIYFALWRKLQIVAGEFRDDFNNGLVNWEYGGEGWATQRGEEGYELSVTNSSDGGITNFGLGWDNYEFLFDCKLMNRNVGWIIRATDREHYIMIQLSATEDGVTLNPHYKVPNGWWILRQELKCSNQLLEKIKSSMWIKVKIIIFGNTIDIYLDNERVMNHHIPDPVRLVVDKKYKWESKEETEKEKGKELGVKELVSFSFPSGKVGFRCSGGEHAHIREVRVKPLFWNSRTLS